MLYQSLVKTFSSLQVLNQKVLNYHWNVTGPAFYETHLVLERVYGMLEKFTDRFAEAIRTYGRAPGLFTVYLRVSSVKENLTIPSAPEMLTELVSDLLLVKADLGVSFKAAEEEQQQGTLNLLGELQENLDTCLYLLQSSRSGFNL